MENTAAACRSRALPTSIRRRRLALGLSAFDVARLAKFSVSKTYRIEKAPLRARVCDLAAVDAVLAELESEVAAAGAKA